MAGKPSTAQDAARRQFERAPADKKPTAREMAQRHKLSESTIHRASWYVAYKDAKKQVAQ